MDARSTCFYFVLACIFALGYGFLAFTQRRTSLMIGFFILANSWAIVLVILAVQVGTRDFPSSQASTAIPAGLGAGILIWIIVHWRYRIRYGARPRRVRSGAGNSDPTMGGLSGPLLDSAVLKSKQDKKIVIDEVGITWGSPREFLYSKLGQLTFPRVGSSMDAIASTVIADNGNWHVEDRTDDALRNVYSIWLRSVHDNANILLSYRHNRNVDTFEFEPALAQAEAIQAGKRRVISEEFKADDIFLDLPVSGI